MPEWATGPPPIGEPKLPCQGKINHSLEKEVEEKNKSFHSYITYLHSYIVSITHLQLQK